MKIASLKQIMNNKVFLWGIQIVISFGLTIGFFYGTAFIKKEYRNYLKISQIKNMMEIIPEYTNTHQRYAGMSNVQVKDMLRQNLHDDNIIVHSDAVISSKLGGMFVTSSDTAVIDGSADDALVLSYINLDMDTCVDLATYDWTNLKSVQLIGVQATSGNYQVDTSSMYFGCDGSKQVESFTTACPNGKEVSIPMSEADALMACRCYGSRCSVILKVY